MIFRRLLPSVVLLFVAVIACAHAATVNLPIAGPTAIRFWNGTAVLSLQDASSSTYRLAVAVRGGVPVPIPGVAAQSQPFDADIGPGPSGTAMIVYARCQGFRASDRSPAHCRLFRTTPAGGEKPISGAAGNGGSETAPTVWGSKLAFARRYATGSAHVYIRPLNASSQTRSVQLPALPRRVCEFESGCRKLTDGTVAELKLYGRNLAQIVNYPLRDGGICGERQVRTVDVRSRHDDLIADTVCGLGGQTWLGLSWVREQLLFGRTCPGDSGGCQNSNAQVYRFTPKTRRTEIAAQPDVLLGFAATDASHALEVRAPLGPNGSCDNYIQTEPAPSCVLTSAGPFAFKPGRTAHS